MSPLPVGWTWSTVGSMCSKPQYGWTTTSSQVSGGLPYLRTTDITKGPIDWGTVPHCVDEPPDPSKYLLADGDIVVSRAGSIGASALVRDPPPAVFASYLIRFRNGPDLDPEYLAHFLQSPGYWRQISDAKAGIAVQNVNAKKLAAIRLPVAPLSEQRRIVETTQDLLWRLEAGKKTVESVAHRAGLLRFASIDQALTDQARTPHWKSMRVGDVLATNGDDPLQQGWSPKCLKVPSADNSVWGVLKTSAVQAGEFVSIENKELPGNLRPRPHLEARPGDVILTSGGPRSRIGVACLVRETRPRLMISDKMFRLRVNTDQIDPMFLELYLQSRHAAHEIERLKTGSNDSGLRISQSAFRGLEILVPDFSEQVRIVEESERTRSLVQALVRQTEKICTAIDALRSSILAAAFSGRLTPLEVVGV